MYKTFLQKINELTNIFEKLYEAGFQKNNEIIFLNICKELFVTYCKFSIGDRVKLNKDLTSWDFMRPNEPPPNFLKKDSTGTVAEHDFYGGQFVYWVEFDNQYSLFDPNKISTEKKRFLVKESFLERAENDSGTESV